MARPVCKAHLRPNGAGDIVAQINRHSGRLRASSLEADAETAADLKLPENIAGHGIGKLCLQSARKGYYQQSPKG